MKLLATFKSLKSLKLWLKPIRAHLPKFEVMEIDSDSPNRNNSLGPNTNRAKIDKDKPSRRRYNR